jgi:hypothetical protein
MSIKNLLYAGAAYLIIYFFFVIGSGCAQMGAPTGGPRDTIPPVLISAVPELLTTDFRGNKITLTFDEYINVKDVQKNVLVSPYPKKFPIIEYKLKTVSIRLKDTLLANTTYAINFGNAITDNNEGNPFVEFTYVFSTGKTIDSLTLSGSVYMAETGKPDSTLMVLLYRNANDSSVQQRKPDYMARVNSSGHFHFTNLSAGQYRLYALNDRDGGKTYNSPTEAFAFLNEDIIIAPVADTVVMYAYEEEKDVKKIPKPVATKAADKKLKLTPSIRNNGQQDLLGNIELQFNNTLKIFDSTKIILTDTNFNKINGTAIYIDSTRKIVTVKNKWPEETDYRLLIEKDAVSDSSDNVLAKSDTIQFITKRVSDYGSLLLRFSNLDTTKHPMIQLLENSIVVKSIPVTGPTWSDSVFPPGEYEFRILYDTNNNGVWDPGNYEKKLQPEHATTLDKKLVIKADWENERDVKL